jgi:hypothetical protein
MVHVADRAAIMLVVLLLRTTCASDSVPQISAPGTPKGKAANVDSAAEKLGALAEAVALSLDTPKADADLDGLPCHGWLHSKASNTTAQPPLQGFAVRKRPWEGDVMAEVEHSDGESSASEVFTWSGDPDSLTDEVNDAPIPRKGSSSVEILSPPDLSRGSVGDELGDEGSVQCTDVLEAAQLLRAQAGSEGRCGRWADACDLYERACLLLCPSDDQDEQATEGVGGAVAAELQRCRLNAALCRLKLESWESAIVTCSKVLSQNPNCGTALFRRGQVTCPSSKGRLQQVAAFPLLLTDPCSHLLLPHTISSFRRLRDRAITLQRYGI